MPQENVETVRRIYALVGRNWASGKAGRGDWEGSRIAELWDPDVVIEENAAFPDRAVYRGYEGLARWWTGFFEVFDDLRLEPQEFVPAGDRVVVPVRHWFRSKAGAELTQEITHVWQLRDARVIHVTGYNDNAEALEAVGLRE
jgi:ketosteroid isomerase-like protein